MHVGLSSINCVWGKQVWALVYGFVSCCGQPCVGGLLRSSLKVRARDVLFFIWEKVGGRRFLIIKLNTPANTSTGAVLLTRTGVWDGRETGRAWITQHLLCEIFCSPRCSANHMHFLKKHQRIPPTCLIYQAEREVKIHIYVPPYPWNILYSYIKDNLCLFFYKNTAHKIGMAANL